MPGIGLAVATQLAEAGAEVVVNSGGPVVKQPVILGCRPSQHVQGDVCDEAAVVQMVDAVLAAHGRLDVVVNNAGATKIVPHANLDGISGEDWLRILGVKVVGAWNVVKAAAPHLRMSPLGAVVNISSMAGIRVTGSSIPYSVSKAAPNQLTRTLAKALGPEIRVNAVAPGFIGTPWTSEWGSRRQEVVDLTPLSRVGVPKDIAAMVLTLVQSSYVTGEIVTVDGGLSLNS